MFQHDLSSLRKIASLPGVNNVALPKLLLHEGAFRLMCGASPLRTEDLLLRKRKGYCDATVEPGVTTFFGPMVHGCNFDQKEESDTNSRSSIFNESTAALCYLLACKHLPPLSSSEDRRAYLLSSAAMTFEQLGDKKRLIDCQKLMAKQGIPSSAMFTLGTTNLETEK